MQNFDRETYRKVQTLRKRGFKENVKLSYTEIDIEGRKG